jgi:3-phenylpropionate/trans-cinnamate dioxygenase ferredoxin reductase subunit
MTRRVVIIGAGQAGCQLAVSLRERKFDGAITLVGEEPGPPYQKPPMSKAFLQGKAEAADLILKPMRYFAEKAIGFIPASSVTAIDRGRRRVAIDPQRSLDYDHLVIAAGAENRRLRIPGADLDGVVMLRSLGDADRLKHRLAAAGRLVILGAGFIGMEVAAVARQRGLEVTVIERADRVLARAVSRPVSDHLRLRHEQEGVRFRFGAGVECFTGHDGALRAVHLADGEVIPAALALIAIGVAPSIGLAEQAGLPADNGILVDAMLTTADPRVHAIGDCANYPHALFDGRRLRVESVQNAVDQARCLAMTLTGEPTPYARLPWFWSDQWDIRLQIAGIAEAEDEAIIRGDPATGRFSVFRMQGGRLSAVESINQLGEHMAARRLVAQRSRLSPADIRNPAAAPEALLGR